MIRRYEPFIQVNCTDTAATSFNVGPALNASDLGTLYEIEQRSAVTSEVWSPQLPSYRPWSSALRTDKNDHREADLLATGALGMGMDDNQREALLAPALHHRQESTSRHACSEPTSSVLFRFVDTPTGWTLSGVDLRAFSECTGIDEGLTVFLPETIEGRPLTRISSDAFSRRLVHNIGVDALVAPSSVEHIDNDAFKHLAAQRLFIGRGVKHLGYQTFDLSLSRYHRERRYTIADDNPFYRSDAAGSVFSADGHTLVFAAAPYPDELTIPDPVTDIARKAQVEGVSLPAIVHAPRALKRIEERFCEESLWEIDPAAPAYHLLKRRNIRCVSARAVYEQGCWYNFDESGCMLAKAPRPELSASQHFSRQAADRAKVAYTGADDVYALDVLDIPTTVAGVPVTAIGPRAIEFAPEHVSFPNRCTTIDQGNRCVGAKTLVLPEGLTHIGHHCFCSRSLTGVVSLPASLNSIGEGCFEYSICCFERVGAIVHISADQLQNCFLQSVPSDDGDGDGEVTQVPFDFARYDSMLCNRKNLPDYLGALLHRLQTPYLLDDTTAHAIVAQLEERRTEASMAIALMGSVDLIESLCRYGFITADNHADLTELLRRNNKPECVIALLKKFPSPKAGTASARFSL